LYILRLLCVLRRALRRGLPGRNAGYGGLGVMVRVPFGNGSFGKPGKGNGIRRHGYTDTPYGSGLYADNICGILGQNRQKTGRIKPRGYDSPDSFAAFKVGNIHHRIPGKRLGGHIVTAFGQFAAYTDRRRSLPD
jgi:hypothetical protein